MSAFNKYNDAIKSEYGIPEFEVASPFFKLAFNVEVEQAQLRSDNAALREAVNEARQIVKAAQYLTSEKSILHGMIVAWLSAHPAEEVKA